MADRPTKGRSAGEVFGQERTKVQQPWASQPPARRPAVHHPQSLARNDQRGRAPSWRTSRQMVLTQRGETPDTHSHAFWLLAQQSQALKLILRVTPNLKRTEQSTSQPVLFIHSITPPHIHTPSAARPSTQTATGIITLQYTFSHPAYQGRLSGGRTDC